MIAAARALAAARGRAHRAPARGPAAVPARALAPRGGPCRAPDHVLHPKILKSPIKFATNHSLIIAMI